MTSDWLKWVKGFSRKREVAAIAERLGQTRRETATLLFEFWEWCDDNVAEDEVNAEGDAVLPSTVSASMLDNLTGAPGFADALSLVGWLYQRNKQICIRKFSRHNGKQAKSRAEAQTRMKRARSDSVAQVLRKKRTRTSSCITPNERFFQSIPEPLRKEEFLEVWNRWVKYRKEIKKELTETQVESQLRALAKKGAERAIEMIEYTISQGWQGLREPDKPANRGSGDPRGNFAAARDYLRETGGDG